MRRVGRIKMPSFDYLGVYPGGPHEAPPLSEWQIGVFLALPITHVEYKNKAGDSLERVRQAGFETAILDW